MGDSFATPCWDFSSPPFAECSINCVLYERRQLQRWMVFLANKRKSPAFFLFSRRQLEMRTKIRRHVTCQIGGSLDNVKISLFPNGSLVCSVAEGWGKNGTPSTESSFLLSQLKTRHMCQFFWAGPYFFFFAWANWRFFCPCSLDDWYPRVGWHKNKETKVEPLLNEILKIYGVFRFWSKISVIDIFLFKCNG